MTKPSSKSRILTAARDLFFRNGFETVSTDMLAREAAVSKATIYRHFDNMLDILRHVVEAEAETFRAAVVLDATSPEDLESSLTDFGRRLLTFLNRTEALDFSCLIYEEARNNPALGQTFHAASLGRTRADLATLFGKAQALGVLRPDADPLDLAEDFAALLQGFGMVRAQLRVSDIPFADVDRQVARAVRTILAAHRA